MKISLIGYRGTGKTTIGAKLAEDLHLGFIDADQLLQERAGRKISEIFATDGEPVFRQLEADLIHELGQLERILRTFNGWRCHPAA